MLEYILASETENNDVYLKDRHKIFTRKPHIWRGKVRDLWRIPINIKFRKADLNDAKELINVYNWAFVDDYIRYGSCPGYGHSIEYMEKSIRDNAKYAILYENKLIGAISVSNKGDGKYYVGCLCIIPAYQRKGIGTKAMQFLQDELIGWQSLELETPASKTENVKFYTQKCGFAIIDKLKNGDVDLYRFIKTAQ